MSISIGNSTAYIDTAQKTASASGLQNTLSKDLSTASEDELMDVCKEFEAYFIEQVLKEAEKTIPNHDEDSSMAKLTDFHKDSVRQKLSETLAEQNGNTFAKTMYEQMKRNYGL
jgi:flagellar protein FlgJ